MSLPPRPVAALLGPALSLLIHLPLLLPGRSAGFRDLTSSHEPLRTLAAGAWLSGEVPHWNPFPDGGAPLLANPSSGALHPSLITSLLFSPPLALTLAVVLQQALGALGVFGLARRRGAGDAGAAVAAMAWAGAGPALSVGTTLNQLNGFAWAPVAAWAAGVAADRGGFSLLPSAAALAAVFLAGEPLAAATALVLAALEVALAAQADGPRPRATAPRRLARGAASLAGGLALAAPGLVPFALLVGRAERAAGFPADLALTWSSHPARFLEALVPMPLGNPAYLAPPGWFGASSFEGGLPLVLSAFVGAPVLLLAGAGLVRGRRDPAALALGGFIVACALLALGRYAPFHAWIEAIPALPPTRYPSKFLVPASLGLALLSGLGWRPLLETSRSRRGTAIWVAATAAGAIGVLLLSRPGAFAILEPPARRLTGFEGSALATASVWLQGQVLIGLGAATLALLAPVVAGRSRAAGRALLGATVAASLVAGSWGMTEGRLELLANPSVPRETLGGPLDEYREALARAEVPPLRVARLAPAAGGGLVAPRGVRRELWERSRWFLRHHAAGLAGVGTALELQPDRMGLYGPAALRSRLPTMPPASRAAVARRLGVGAVESYGDADWPGIEPVGALVGGYALPRLKIARLQGALPPARLVGAAYLAPSDDDAFRTLVSQDLDPRAAVILSGGAEAGRIGGEPGEAGWAKMTRVGLSEVRVDLDATRDGWLVLTENYDRGWTAAVDGAPAPVLRADLVLRAVEVPAGRHEVALRYRTPGWTVGLTVAAASLVLLAASAWIDRRISF